MDANEAIQDKIKPLDLANEQQTVLYRSIAKKHMIPNPITLEYATAPLLPEAYPFAYMNFSLMGGLVFSEIFIANLRGLIIRHGYCRKRELYTPFIDKNGSATKLRYKTFSELLCIKLYKNLGDVVI